MIGAAHRGPGPEPVTAMPAQPQPDAEEELARDHRALGALAVVAAETDSVERARGALTLAIRLLRLHAGCGSPALKPARTSLDYTLLLAGQLEAQMAQQDFLDDPILIARLRSLRWRVGELQRAESGYEAAAEVRERSAPPYARSAHARRTRAKLLRDARRLIDSAA
ncbi:hypothetical protein [Sinimarinibacterium flocculans]|uniref:hypothetical protein n=1 Tax=Sinimarinibacterium flocculans TaxID=985250 RepID=UPI003C78CE20